MNDVEELKYEQQKQEEEYSFPYHYIAQFENNNFRPFFIDTWAINYASTIEFLLDKIGSESVNKIVDIGCGDGRFTRELARSFQSTKITGIDFSSKAIDLAAAMNTDIQNISFNNIDITQSEVPDQFDIAVLMEVFEHIPLENAGKFIESVHSLIRKGGYLYLTVPHTNKPIEYKHFQHFTVDSLSRYFSNNFEVIDIIPFEKISSMRRVLLRLLSNKYFILNNARLLSYVYRYYKNNLFNTRNEEECQRIYMKARVI